MTREADSTVTLGSRTLLANGSGADLFVSLHRNSYTDPAANGTEIWVDTAAGAAETAMAAAVLEELARVGVQSNRGVKKGNYHVLRETAMPAMLVELGFVSNEEDNRLFDRRFERYAQAIARGVCGALGIAAPPQGENAGEEAPKYKVQVGAFRREENARAFLRQVREMGLEAFLIREEDQAG